MPDKPELDVKARLLPYHSNQGLDKGKVRQDGGWLFRVLREVQQHAEEDVGSGEPAQYKANDGSHGGTIGARVNFRGGDKGFVLLVDVGGAGRSEGVA